MRLSLIAAMDRRGVIGRAGGMPWYLPADLRHFKRVTMGKPLIMGRVTHESIGKALPGRTNIVMTRDPGFVADGCSVVHSPEEALEMVVNAEEAVIAGGARVYEAFLPRIDRMYLTHIDAEFEGDTWFPAIDWTEWRETVREYHPADARNCYPMSFVVYDRT